MSVNDGFSDSEWGAWGKTDEVAVKKNIDSNIEINAVKRNDNGFGSDDEINTNSEQTSKFSSNKYNGGGGGGSRFQTKKEDNDYPKRYTNRDNSFTNNKDSFKNNRSFNNNNNKDGDYKRFNNDRNGFNNDRNGFNNDNRNKSNDFGANRNNRFDRDGDDYRKKRDDSNEKRPSSNRYRDDSYDRKKKRDDSNDRKKKRDDKRRDRRDDSDDDSRDRFKNRRNDRDESKENRRKFVDNDRRYNRDDSRDRPRQKRRDDSRENDRNTRKYRDDSRENDRNQRKYRDDSRDDDRNRRKYRESDRKSPDRFRDHRRQNGDDSDDDYLSNKFEKSMKFERKFDRDADGDKEDYNRKDGFTSRTFIRGQKPELDNQSNKDGKTDDSAALPKRATFIPDDDQEDYKLHVNSGINFDNYDKIPVDVTGENAPGAIASFGELELPEFLMENIRDMKYVKLTPVQKYAVPIIDRGRDLMACAQTGSGKTAAFLIPIIKGLHGTVAETDSSNTSSTAFPRALIMTPTRELCRQIFTAARLLCRGSNIRCAYMYGGIEMNKSRRNIQATGCDILVATPGRLIHFLELVWVSLRYIKYFVLDEADRMLDEEGFYEVVNKIYKEAHQSGDADRSIHLSMFSATFPNEIQTLASRLLSNYLFLAVGVVGSANCDVKQEIIRAEQRDKVNSAIELIKTIPDEKTLIFVESKRMADFFGIKLGYLGFKATTIHGDREQEQRESALNDFKSGRVNFMVATNVAARGLDIPKVDNVINIDMPDTIDTYVHRIGRTGRCGNVGRAISFFDEGKDLSLAGALVGKLQEANQPVEQWLRELAAGSVGAICNPRYSSNSRDTRKNVKINKYVDNPNEQDDDDAAGDGGFMRGSNVDYDDSSKPGGSEWLDE